MKRKTKPKADLKPPGMMLWKWIDGSIENMAEVEPAVEELCKVADRLEEVRSQINADGVMVGGKPHGLLALEVKLSGQFRNLWRASGLGDRTDDARRPVGRPEGT